MYLQFYETNCHKHAKNCLRSFFIQ
jgi:hypothetical protein